MLGFVCSLAILVSTGLLAPREALGCSAEYASCDNQDIPGDGGGGGGWSDPCTVDNCMTICVEPGSYVCRCEYRCKSGTTIVTKSGPCSGTSGWVPCT